MVNQRTFFILTTIFFSILFLNFISASCNSGQIDINSASVEELDKIIWVGNATAQKIIALRPFNSINELTKVSGIGDIKLANITSQGLACVENDSVIKEENNVNNKTSNESIADKNNLNLTSNISSNNNIQLETISLSPLNPKAIKSGGDFKISDNKDLAIYGFLGFTILLGLLFLIKGLIKKKKYKNGLA